MSSYLVPGKKVILVIGATGAQGQAIIDKLLAPAEDGSLSPYAVRALTRDPDSSRVTELSAKGVECVKGGEALRSIPLGRFDHFDSVAAALHGVYGAWVNTDGFTAGEPWETYAGMRIFELAKQAGVQHYVWSNLDYAFKIGGYDEKYRCEHYDAKGRVGEWMQAQASDVHGAGMTWSIVTSCPYMDMLHNLMFGPIAERADGKVVFATPVGAGQVPMIALSDLGFFARYTFDNWRATSGVDLRVASDLVGWERLRATFERVSGRRAVVVHMSLAEWFEWRRNFEGWWALWRDGVVTRDMEWIRKVHPRGHTLESWMKEQHYGEHLWENVAFLKNSEDGRTPTLKIEKSIALSKL
ncbi:hypothetical protein IEO21_06353 [Rhodonia placenta]|uniref:NmrA-like domain-containing protein n=1 Tax=Rhodonia placenta TaxID=104341 RepID=A0A8H7P0L6_9APHY|nr:hypothetical protein IEO21_06353 [Postia placenta]